jgi:hypothetical protein
VLPVHSKGPHLVPNFSTQTEPSVELHTSTTNLSQPLHFSTMPGLLKTNSTQAIANKRDSREFDEISDAVDEGWYHTLVLLTAGSHESDALPLQ